MPNYVGGMSVCPFYLREADNSICCHENPSSHEDGTVNPLDDVVIMARFANPSSKLNYEKNFCLRYYYPYCPIASVLIARESLPDS